MAFPLADWILSHPGMPHDLAESGMKGQLRSAQPILRKLRPGRPAELRAHLGAVLGIAKDRIVLTTGATTANTLVLLYLRDRLCARSGRSLTAGLVRPEYPPLWDAAKGLGLRVSEGLSGKDLAILSNPNNPEGYLRTEEELLRATEGSKAVLVDETFREFTLARSLARRGRANLWTTGTFTKVYGTDDIRIGFAVAPPEEASSFADEADLWVDRPSLASVGVAQDLLRARERVVGESRRLYLRNLEVLRERVDPEFVSRAPVWFDRGIAPGTSLKLAQTGLRKGVLVCPGHYFRDPSGVRVCLTQRSFPEDLEAYLSLRRRFESSSSRARGATRSSV